MAAALKGSSPDNAGLAPEKHPDQKVEFKDQQISMLVGDTVEIESSLGKISLHFVKVDTDISEPTLTTQERQWEETFANSPEKLAKARKTIRHFRENPYAAITVRVNGYAPETRFFYSTGENTSKWLIEEGDLSDINFNVQEKKISMKFKYHVAISGHNEVIQES